MIHSMPENIIVIIIFIIIKVVEFKCFKEDIFINDWSLKCLYWQT